VQLRTSLLVALLSDYLLRKHLIVQIQDYQVFSHPDLNSPFFSFLSALLSIM
jgi:hypothetical protein